jgi:hypothetical protein
MTSVPNEDNRLSDHELRELEALEDRLGRGTAVKWDKPKTIKGYLVRPIEEAEVRDYNDPTKRITKKLATLRTSSGLQAIWEGPDALEKLFEIKGHGMPVIVAYVGEKIGQESQMTYKAFDVVAGEVPTAAPEDAAGPDDDIRF